jgi:hypothetical protein
MKQVIKLVRTLEISNIRAVIAEYTVEDGLTLRVILTGVVGGYTSMVQNLSLSNLREMVMDVLPSE